MNEREREALAALLAAHAARYPGMEPTDAVKLLYQHEFGGGHLISDPAASLAYIKKEQASCGVTPGRPLAEDIGNGLVRVMLDSPEAAAYPPEELNADFVRSAARHTGDRARFLEELEVLRAETEAGRLPFSPAALEEYLAAYAAAGYPAVSHSDAYRRAYRPAYRVVEERVSLRLFIRRVEALSREREQTVVALDGRCASGKTTLAVRLAEEYGWGLLHMDDFFLRPEQRTPARYAAPGENVDHERFLAEVLLPLREGALAAYRPFDCGTMTLAAPVTFRPARVVLVEGSYACHPALWEHYDLRAFLTVDPAEQLRRIEARGGPGALDAFREKWIPLEEKYFAAFRVEERCDYSLLV